MDKTLRTSTTDERPLAGCDAASAPPCDGFTLRGRDWIDSAASGYPANRAPAPGRGLIG